MSVLNHNLKDAEETKSTALPYYDLVPEPDACEPAAQSTSREPATTTQTEQANRDFLSEVQKISGVIAAKTVGGQTVADQSIVVFVPTLLSDVSEEVIDLQSRLHRMFPLARLEVRIKGLQERGFDPAQVTPSDLARL